MNKTLIFSRILLGVLIISGCQQNDNLTEIANEDVVAVAITDIVSDEESSQEFIPSPTSEEKSEDNNMETKQLGNADVVFVRAVRTGENTWTFHVAVNHPDTGWDDYADGWDVLLEDGTVLKPNPNSPFTRLLLHPHENEQPFTRSQSGVIVPEGNSIVIVRAHELKDGYGGLEVVVDLNQESGEKFEVQKE